jgi:hypothetical protein
LKTLLDVLRKNLLDKHQTTANVVAIQSHVKENVIQLDQGQKDLLESILSRLANGDTISAMGGNAYTTAREEILATLPVNLRREVEPMFTQFEAEADRMDTEAKKKTLTTILNYIADNASTHHMSKNDIDGIILPQFCAILAFYEIQSTSCVTSDSAPLLPSIPVESAKKSVLPLWLQVILRIVGGGILIVGGVIVFFAIKAKIRAGEEEEDENDDDGA